MEQRRLEAFALAQEHFKPLIRAAESIGKRMKPERRAMSYKRCPFLRHGAADDILSEQALRDKVVGKVVHLDAAPEEHDDVKRIIGPPGLRAILLTILCGGTAQMMRSFELHFLQEPSCDKSDLDLPFDEDFAKQIFGSDGGAFFRWQFAFVAVTLEEGTFRREYQHLRCLPYLEEEKPLGRGAYGTVQMVKIERRHFIFREPRSRNSDHVFLARKDFAPDKESYEAFKAEDLILKDFINTSNCPSNIMTSKCSLVCTLPDVDFPASSIFFPPAKCNLYQYMTDYRNQPNSETARLHNIQQMLGICQALEWLAGNLVYVSAADRFVQATYYHCDLKPDNILVCQHPSAGRDTVVFKLADFGQAQSLQQRLDGQKMGPGPTIDVSGREATYLAPEAQDTNIKPEFKSKSDVWSFGCILLLVILFNYEGAVAIGQFQENRMANSSSLRRGDHFYREAAAYGTSICNTAVTGCIDRLIRNTAGNSYVDSSIVNASLKYLKKSILVRHKERHDIFEVSKKLHTSYNARPPLVAGATTHGGIPANATHCSHGPDGKVFFYSSQKIAVFKDEGPAPCLTIVPTTQESAWSSAVRPRSRSCANEALCVVSKHNSFFECAIHSTAGPERELRQRVRLKDVTTPVNKVAFSPDGRMLAIACRPKEYRASHARVRMYNLQDIREEILSSSLSMASRTTVSSSSVNTLMPNDGDLLREVGKVESVKDIVDFCFSSNSRTLYYAYFWKGEDINAAPQVRVHMWNTATRYMISKCVIHDTDTTFPDRFLKRIVPFHTQVGFMGIAHGKVIVRQTLQGNYMHGEAIDNHGVVGLKSLLISPDDQKVVLLATPARDGPVKIYGGLIGALEAPKELEIRDKIRFTPENDSACIREEDNKIKLLITSLGEKMTYSVDLGRLFAV